MCWAPWAAAAADAPQEIFRMADPAMYQNPAARAPRIDGVYVKPLKLVADERGYLMEMLRADDPFFVKFGQCYISATYPGVVKAWHYHRVQTDHFVCMAGMVKLVLYDSREQSPTRGVVNEFFLGDQHRALVVVPNLVFHGWKCISPEMSLVVNTPSEPYDYTNPDEFRAAAHGEIPYDWTRKDG
jgi:dTDP-4-dehydrorhamnose 3,5-epimerase